MQAIEPPSRWLVRAATTGARTAKATPLQHVEQDGLVDPIEIRFLNPAGVIFQPQQVATLVKSAFLSAEAYHPRMYNVCKNWSQLIMPRSRFIRTCGVAIICLRSLFFTT